VKTPTIAAMACLTLLAGLEPAIAQATYSLSVSRHPSVQLTEDKVDRILADASRMLQKKSGYKDRPDDVACNVTLKRDGAVHTFASSNTPAVITNESERDAVHKENRVLSARVGKQFQGLLMAALLPIDNCCR
jgi:hypothetical protein